MVLLPGSKGASSGGSDGASTYPEPEPWWTLPEKYWIPFEKHWLERVTQKYASTNPNVTPAMQRAALMGETCMHVFLGQEPDFRNKPLGDHGIDAVIRWQGKTLAGHKYHDWWLDLDVKTTTMAAQELSQFRNFQRYPGTGFETYKLYVCAYCRYYDLTRVQLTGWLSGHEVLRKGKPQIRIGKEDGVERPFWVVERQHLRPMSELKEKVLNSFHHDDHRLTRWAI